MLLLALLLVPVVTSAASYWARRREEMERFNLAGFGLIFLIAVGLAAQSDGEGAQVWNGGEHAVLEILHAAHVRSACFAASSSSRRTKRSGTGSFRTS